jgi:hypothetical protein
MLLHRTAKFLTVRQGRPYLDASASLLHLAPIETLRVTRRDLRVQFHVGRDRFDPERNDLSVFLIEHAERQRRGRVAEKAVVDLPCKEQIEDEVDPLV